MAIPSTTVWEVIGTAPSGGVLPSGPVLRLKATAGLWKDTAGTVPATTAGDVVARWDDQSGNGRNFAQTTSGLQPTLQADIVTSLPVVRFDGADDKLTATIANFAPAAKTVLAVFRPRSVPSGVQGILSNGTANWYVGVTSLSQGRISFANTAGTAVNITSAPMTSNHVRSRVIAYRFSVSGANVNVSVRADRADYGVVSATTGGINATVGSSWAVGSVGGGLYIDGDLSELVVYDRDLTDAELDSATQKLMADWSLASAGSSTNGGGYDSAKFGTGSSADYSRPGTPQIAVTDAVANGTTTITSATATWDSSHVGNLIYLAGGSGSLSPTRRLVSSVTNATTIVVDSAVASGTGIALNLGGAVDHPATILGSVVASNVVWVKSGVAYLLSSSLSSAVTCTPSSSVPYTKIEGYGTTRGDGGQASLTVNTTLTTALNFTGNGVSVANFAIDGIALTTNGLIVGQNSRVRNVKVSRTTGTGIQADLASAVELCEVTLCGGSYAINAPRVIDCNVHDNTCTGIYSPGGLVENCLVTNNTGTTSDGILAGLSTADSPVFRCTVHGNGRHGINWQATTAPLASGNILSSNGGYGFLCNASAGYRASPFHDGNAYYNNTSGTRSNGGDTTVNPQNASGVYANPLDRVLTVNPFTNAAGGDFSLNATAGGGASCRGAGFPTSWPGSTAISYIDMGAIQHQGGAFSVIGSPFIRGANT